MIKSFTAVIGALSIGFASGWFCHDEKPEKIRIVEKTKTVTEYLRPGLDRLPPAQALPALASCYLSPIRIDATVDGAWLRVVAQDDCKKSARGFLIGTSGDWRMYAGLAVAGVIIGGLTVWRLK